MGMCGCKFLSLMCISLEVRSKPNSTNLKGWGSLSVYTPIYTIQTSVQLFQGIHVAQHCLEAIICESTWLDSSNVKHVMFNLLCRDILDKKRLLLTEGRCNKQDMNILELRVELLHGQLKVSMHFFVYCVWIHSVGSCIEAVRLEFNILLSLCTSTHSWAPHAVSLLTISFKFKYRLGSILTSQYLNSTMPRMSLMPVVALPYVHGLSEAVWCVSMYNSATFIVEVGQIFDNSVYSNVTQHSNMFLPIWLFVITTLYA